MRILLAAFAVLLPTPAMAESWYFVAANEDAVVFADADSLVRNGNVEKFVDFVDDDSTKYAKNSIEMDCSQKQYRFVGSEFYDLTRKPISSEKGAGDWQTVQAGSVADALLAFACDGKRDDKVADPFEAGQAYWDAN